MVERLLRVQSHEIRISRKSVFDPACLQSYQPFAVKVEHQHVLLVKITDGLARGFNLIRGPAPLNGVKTEGNVDGVVRSWREFTRHDRGPEGARLILWQRA